MHASAHEPPLQVEAPYVAELVRQEMIARFGGDVLNKGYHVTTTINAEMQTAANLAVRDGLLAYDHRHGWHGVEQQVALGAGDEAEAQAEEDVASWLAAGSHRVLLRGGEPVAMSGFNARLPGIVQVGAVWTPPEHRSQGFARACVALHLADHPTDTPAQVASALTSAATTGVVTNPGTGSPNRLLYVGTGTQPPTGPRFETTTDYAIADSATVESPVTVSGVTGNAPSDLAVEVHIVHTYIGDLQVQLIAPDGTAYTLKAYGTGGSADNIDTTYTVNASSEVANGTWKLRVSDNATYDTGRVDAWALQF